MTISGTELRELAELAASPAGASLSATTLRAVIAGLLAELDAPSRPELPIDWHSQVDARGRPVDGAGRLIPSARQDRPGGPAGHPPALQARQALTGALGAPEPCAVCGHRTADHRPGGGECLANSGTCSCQGFSSLAPRAEL